MPEPKAEHQSWQSWDMAGGHKTSRIACKPLNVVLFINITILIMKLAINSFQLGSRDNRHNLG